MNRKTLNGLVITFTIIGTLAAPGTIHAQCQYEVTIMQDESCWVGGIEFPTRPAASAVEGEWVGGGHPGECFTEESHPSIWSEETGYIFFEKPPDVDYAGVRDMNLAAGHIAGDMDFPGTNGLAFRVEGTQIVNIGTLPGYLHSGVAEVNANGRIVGNASFTAVYWDIPDGPTVVPLPKHSASWGTSVTDQNEVVGYLEFEPFDPSVPYIWSEGRVSFPPYPDGWSELLASHINNRREIVGSFWAEDDNGEFARFPCYWPSPDAMPVELPRLATHDFAAVLHVNDASLMGGMAWIGPFGNQAVIWVHGEIYHLIDLIDDPSVSALREVVDIDEMGNMVVRGGEAGVGTAFFVLRPIDPSPADITGDCATDVNDLLRLLGDWGNDTNADYDNSGAVGAADLLFLLEHWTIQ